MALHDEATRIEEAEERKSKLKFNRGSILRKTIFFLVFILILIPLLATCSKSSISTTVKTIKIKKLVETKTQGWEWKVKEVTKTSDVEQVLRKL